MYAVIVTFEIDPTQTETFQTLMLEQAKNSLENETECHYFDVVIDEINTNIFHLYELYTNAAAFKLHLDSQHFQTFNEVTASMVKNKTVVLGNRLAS